MGEERHILGLLEHVQVHGRSAKKKVIARIDTGATKSSICTDLAEELNVGPIEKTKIVRQAHGKTRRPLVNLTIKINGKELSGEFTIADRAHMKYQLLVGQNILKAGAFLVDPLKEGPQ